VERVGLPEARIPLAEAAVYVATAPKSNAAYMALDRALESVRRVKTSVPGHLMNVHANGVGDEEKAVGYKYAHDYPNHFVRQQYLPDEIKNERFYEPGEIGYEKTVNDRLKMIKEETS
jgi:putative ATPase